MARKNATQYQKEYVDKVGKLEGLKARIKARAEELCRLHPDAPIGSGAVAREFEKLHTIFDLNTDSYIMIIKKIEEYTEKKSGHVQTTFKY